MSRPHADTIDEHLVQSAARRVLVLTEAAELSAAERAALAGRVAAELRTLLRTRDEWAARTPDRRTP